MKKYAVLVAGGQGSRMNSSIPKQFMLLKHKPVVFYTINSFLKAYDDIEIILVLPQEHMETGEKIIRENFLHKKIRLITGGNTRFASVKNGLSLVKEESIVFVHDAVRCMVSPDLITRCYKMALENGSAIPVVNSKDSVRITSGNQSKAVDRNTVKLVQTPQVFKSTILLTAFTAEYEESFTDEATVVEHSGYMVNLVDGDENNIKITHRADLLIAEKILDTSSL